MVSTHETPIVHLRHAHYNMASTQDFATGHLCHAHSNILTWLMPPVIASHTTFTARVALRHHSLRFSTYLCYCFTNLHYGTRHRAIYQSTRRHTARTRIFYILDTSTSTPAQAYDSDIHQYSMYFQRKGGRSVPHPPILISYPQSLRLHAHLTVMPKSHLYLHSCS